MKILALITARGGSKRLPGKNIRPLAGVPLIQWSINAARGIEEIADILVSTDCAAIAATARQSGALVPWLRPAELATDTASSLDVCLHALDWYESARGSVDGLLLLQPTSPFRRPDTIRQGIDLFRENKRPVIAVSPARSHPYWCFHIKDGSLRPYADDCPLNLRSQDLPPAFVVNGAFYLIGPEDLRRCQSLYGDGAPIPLVMPSVEESLDIDTELDWAVAETVAGSLCKK